MVREMVDWMDALTTFDLPRCTALSLLLVLHCLRAPHCVVMICTCSNTCSIASGRPITSTLCCRSIGGAVTIRPMTWTDERDAIFIRKLVSHVIAASQENTVTAHAIRCAVHGRVLQRSHPACPVGRSLGLLDMRNSELSATGRCVRTFTPVILGMLDRTRFDYIRGPSICLTFITRSAVMLGSWSTA
jgi:hypothetical protein